ncbi:tyrosine-type recombinase/integrase [Nocardiopsis dassonvillei]|uniref:tyrosine-type recombinase/integrase n=1 Tax=Nocardiopsis dassonvillei TaxID=2014 RepID=UPI0020A3A892|nr:tyrosine-type recombinase/integrase [Nocardiopsis dassonvillei]MCP3013518.1 tyrosine-type recombinase/integrase [Nocardiopsis dassonvillei]
MHINDTLVRDYLDTVRLRGRSPETLRTYRHSLRHFVEFLGDEDLREATPRTIRAFLSAEMAAGTAPTSVVRFFGDVRAFYKWLLREEEVTSSPVDRVDAPSAALPPVDLVDVGDITKLLRVRGRNRFLDTRNRVILSLLFDTGMRIGELLNMRTGDLNLSADTVTVHGKTGYRTIGYGATTAVALRRYLRQREQHRLSELPDLFITVRGPLNYEAARQMLRTYCDAAGVTRTHAHAARHTWASRQLESDAGEETVRVAGGWSGTASMRRYVRTATERRAAELNRRHSVVDGL